MLHRFRQTGFYHKNRLRNYMLVLNKDPREYTFLDRVGATNEWRRQQRRINTRAQRTLHTLMRLNSVDITEINRRYWEKEFLFHSDPSIQHSVNRGLMTRLEGRYHNIRADIALFFLHVAPLYGNNN